MPDGPEPEREKESVSPNGEQYIHVFFACIALGCMIDPAPHPLLHAQPHRHYTKKIMEEDGSKPVGTMEEATAAEKQARG